MFDERLVQVIIDTEECTFEDIYAVLEESNALSALYDQNAWQSFMDELGFAGHVSERYRRELGHNETCMKSVTRRIIKKFTDKDYKQATLKRLCHALEKAGGLSKYSGELQNRILLKLNLPPNNERNNQQEDGSENVTTINISGPSTPTSSSQRNESVQPTTILMEDDDNTTSGTDAQIVPSTSHGRTWTTIFQNLFHAHLVAIRDSIPIIWDWFFAMIGNRFRRYIGGGGDDAVG